MEFSFFNPLPRHFGWIVFAFLALYRPTDYVYKIWFSLVQGKELSFLNPPPLWVVFWGNFFKQKFSEITSPTTLLIRQFAVELMVWELFDNFHLCAPPQTPFWGQDIKTLYS